jgi:hypothetical protein
MQKQPRSEKELKNLTVRLIIVVLLVMYLFTPSGNQTFFALVHWVARMFAHL